MSWLCHAEEAACADLLRYRNLVAEDEEDAEEEGEEELLGLAPSAGPTR